MKTCTICPRECHVDRENGTIGYCGETSKIRVAKTALHQWEEPCITGKYGSGTVFFSGCNLRCVFCQNHAIAHGSVGMVFSKEELADSFLNLQENKASNINLVTGAHFAQQLIPVIERAKDNGLVIPIVYNSSGYETVETLRKLDGLIDVYLPDCKFMDSEISRRYAGADNYFEVAKAAIAEMVRQVGEPVFDTGAGTMKRGVIVRHLILPGHTKDSKNILKYLYDTYRNQIYISIMNQFTPVVRQDKYENLNRRVTKREYRKVVDYAIELGIENAFVQEGETAKESFIPKFDCSFI